MTHVSTPLSPPPLTWIAIFGSLFCPWRSWFPDLFCRQPVSARLQNTRQRISSDWKTLEDHPANLHTHSGLEWILSKHFFFSSGRRLSSSNCSFIVYCKRSSASPTSFCWHVYANRHAQLRIGPTVRRVRNTGIRNAYQKSSHISLRLCWISERVLMH